MNAVQAVEAGEIFMLPPTSLTCLDVGQYADVATVLVEARERRVEMFMPEVVLDEDEFILSTPPRYEQLLAERP